MIGLKRGTVKLVRRSAKWGKSFEREKKRIHGALRKEVLDIQHVGSTAIPRIAAKPIIDIAVGIESMREAKKLVKSFEKIGYEWRKEFGGNIQLLFVRGSEKKRTHYVHVMKYGGILWKNYLKFRDHLAYNRIVAQKYGKIKRELAKKFPNDRGSYTASKQEFIKAILDKPEIPVD